MSARGRRADADTTIVRVVRTERHVSIPNDTVRDCHLSLQAVGLLAYVLSVDDTTWRLNGIRGIRRHRGGFGVGDKWQPGRGGVGQDRIETAIRELRHEGYCVVTRRRRDDGTLGATVYTFRDVRGDPDPAVGPRPPRRVRPRPPRREKPDQDNPDRVNRSTQKPKDQKTESQKYTPQPPTPLTRRRGSSEDCSGLLDKLRREGQPSHVVDLIDWFGAEGLRWWADAEGTARQLCEQLANASPRAVQSVRQALRAERTHGTMPPPWRVVQAVRDAEQMLHVGHDDDDA